MKQNHIIIGISIALILAALLWWSASFTNSARAGFWPGTTIPCLPNGHQNLALHIHPTLQVFVQGEEVPVGANIGISPTCMAEVHTHEANGVLHIESTNPNATYTITDFFAVLGEDLYREGFTLTATVNGTVIDAIETYALNDHDAVVLSYEISQ